MDIKNWTEEFEYIPKNDRKSDNPVIIHFQQPKLKQLIKVKDDSGISFKGDLSNPDTMQEARYSSNIGNKISFLSEVITGVDNLSFKGQPYEWKALQSVKDKFFTFVLRYQPGWLDELIDAAIGEATLTKELEKN